MSVWLTSDTHFGHGKIVELGNRPFPSVEHMDAEMMGRWNERVRPDDEVFHLGDFALAPAKRVKEIREKLNGRIYLIVGNHDSRKAAREAGFDMVVEGPLTYCPFRYGPRYFMSHVPHPLDVNDRDNRGVAAPAKTDLHFCGHVHYRWKRIRNVINVGVDQWDYAPVSLNELVELSKEAA